MRMGQGGQKVTQMSESSEAHPCYLCKGDLRVDRCANEGCKEAAQTAETSESWPVRFTCLQRSDGGQAA